MNRNENPNPKRFRVVCSKRSTRVTTHLRPCPAMKLTATQSKFKQIGQSATALRAVRASPPITLTGELPMNRGVNRTAYIAA